MTLSIAIVIGFMCLSGVYVYFMNVRRKNITRDYNAENQYHHAAEILPDVMSNTLKDIKVQMKDAQVDAITQCAHITNFGKQAASAAITAAKTVAWAAVGVKARYRQADSACYLVLSGEDVHYLFYEEGAMKEHLVFDKYRMMNAGLEQISGSDKVTRMGSTMGLKSQKLVLDIDGKKMEIIFYNRINRLPSGPLSVTGGNGSFFKTVVDLEIMGLYFKEQLGKKYIQLSA